MTHQNPDITTEGRINQSIDNIDRCFDAMEVTLNRLNDNIDRRFDAMEATLNRLNDDIRAHRQTIHLDNKATARSTYAVSVVLIIASILLLVLTG